ncbi:helix-turn-helix domain-containing protein [bacterium]|nr:helix-turn-helix domain-containing protein [bacterium]
MKQTENNTRQTLINGNRDALARGLSELFVELDVQVCADKPSADLVVDTRVFGDLELLRTSSKRGAFSVIRSEEVAGRSTFNNFFIACILRGRITLSQESRTIALQISDLAVLDSTRPYRIDVSGGLDVLWIRVPRHRIEGRIPGAAEVLAQRIDGSIGAGHLTSTLVNASLQEAERLSTDESLRISNALLDLLCLSLDISTSQGDAKPKQLLRRIQNYIDANLSDTGLNRDTISGRHGISPRYLNKIFEREGLSAARWIRLRRLELSRQRVEAEDPSDVTISEIAYSCGFNDLSSFNRAFKRHFGATPSSLRKARRRARDRV